MRSHLVTLAFAALASACSGSHALDPDAAAGVCCPVTSFIGCSPGYDPLPGGGWATSLAACTYTIAGYDGRPFEHVTDSYGCEVVREASSGCCGCPPSDGGPLDAGPAPLDAGPAPLDAGPAPLDAGPSACDGLSVVPCLEGRCVPTFDDACCSSCSPGGCADCSDWTYYSCRPAAQACAPAGSCGSPAPWGCSGAPDCAGASVTDEDSCSVAGCVPAYPSGEGEPDPSTAVCVPIHVDVCRVACRRLAPPCPERTTAEGDGFCYTERCVPAFVCER